MATIDLGKIKLVWRGTYDGSTAYTVDDVVQHTDSGLTSSFICTTNSTGNAPSTGGSVHGSWAYLAKGGVAGTDVGTTLTTQGDILYRDGSGLQRLAKGTAAQQLAMNAGATAPEWVNASSDYVKIASTTLGSDTASIIHDNCFTSTYDVYQLEIINFMSDQSSSNSHPRIYLRKGGSSGADQDSINYCTVTDYAYGNFNGGSQSRSGDKTFDGNGWRPLNGWHAPNNSHNIITLKIHHKAGKFMLASGVCGGVQDDGGSASFHSTHQVHSTDIDIIKGTNLTGIKLVSVSGNIKAGCTMAVYGIKI